MTAEAGAGPSAELRRLAEGHGVRTEHRDGLDRKVRPSDDSLRAVLGALGIPADTPSEVAASLRRTEEARGTRLVQPVSVSVEGGGAMIRRGPRLTPGERVEVALALEDGSQREAFVQVGLQGLPLPGRLPAGVHRVQVEAADRHEEAWLIVAPDLTYGVPGEEFEGPAAGREWGVFLPLHALRSVRDWGMGDLTDLGRLVRWTGERGGDAVATLPLLAAFLDEPLEPSPYAPASRLFWNEVFLDPTRTPEWERSQAAREVAGSTWFRERVQALRRAPLVEHRAVARLQWDLLDHLAESWHAGGGEDEEAFRAFARRRPELRRYAAFRAATEARGEGWRDWPQAWRREGIPPEAYDAKVFRRHLYGQYRFDGQLGEIPGEGSAGLYLDLPLSCHRAGFEPWAHPQLFAENATLGAPPDGFHAEGQDWGLPPVVPERSRQEGHGHLRRVLSRLLPHARYLRVDHVMGLHQMYWIPRGMRADQGAYVRNAPHELYALLALESHRHRTVLVGEDLGTVPPEVRTAMDRWGLRRMYVVPFEIGAAADGGPAPVPPGAVASLNTHDLPPFAAAWEESELRRGLQDVARAVEAAAARTGDGPHGGSEGGDDGPDAGMEDWPEALRVLRRILQWLGLGPAGLVLVSLEDLWLEDRPQNRPGVPDPANWRRRARLSLEEFTTDERVLRCLESLHRARRRGKRSRTGAPKGGADGGAGPEPRLETATGAGAEERASTSSTDDPGRRGETPEVQSDHVETKKPEAPMDQVHREDTVLTPDDLHLFNEGTHSRLYRKLGAHLSGDPDRPGARFAVWAPNARRVSVVGDFNEWDPEAHPLSPRAESGIWEGFVQGVRRGALYKYEIHSRSGDHRVQKADPLGFRHEEPPRTASVVWDLEYEWGDDQWMASRDQRNVAGAPISVYEVHLGSWRRDPNDPERLRSYRELAPELAAYLTDMGFTHVEFLPLMEHPFYGSWGYQTTGYFAPTSRYGAPQDFMYLVDHLHQEGIGVILDWVPSHFPSDEHGLAYFDGTHLYEHADPRQGFHPDWESLIFNYGRNEVRSFLLSSALFWLDLYHVDGLRVDAVASMLYLDYSREDGEWVPNRYGGRENLEAIEFLRTLNDEVHRSYPDVQTVAEESTAWPMVSRPTDVGGLGFGMKWDMGWMHDVLRYLARDPLYRKHHHDELTFRALYAFNENFMLPLSHDEVVHGKGSLLGRMPGDEWQRRANLRLLLAHQFLQPGKKLLFMGGEFGQPGEWDHDGQLDWHLLERPEHAGIRRLVRELNRIYRRERGLHTSDFRPEGFEWVAVEDAERSVLAFLRKSVSDPPAPPLLAVFNFTPVPRENYRLGVPRGGRWDEVLNTDAEAYGGSDQGNLGGVEAHPVGAHGRTRSVVLTLPPLAAVVLRRAEQ